jgi:hypothetical protein
MNTNGTGFRTLHNFATVSTIGNVKNSEGAYPHSALTLFENTLYGVAPLGGSGGYGTIFSVTLPLNPPSLSIVPEGGTLILTWPATSAGFSLQFTTDLASAIWTSDLDQRSGASSHRSQRAIHRHQSDFGHTAVFPIESLGDWWKKQC